MLSGKVVCAVLLLRQSWADRRWVESIKWLTGHQSLHSEYVYVYITMHIYIYIYIYIHIHIYVLDMHRIELDFASTLHGAGSGAVPAAAITSSNNT